MLNFLSILYGIHLVFLIYFISFMAVRGIFKGGAIPIVVTLGKYFLYYFVILFGFKHLQANGILIGFVGGLYLSLIGACVVHLWREKKKPLP